jgi:hypothetical protein
MATAHWTSGKGGVWSDGLDWSGGVVPAVTDDVVIDAVPVGAGYTVRVNGQDAADSLSVIAGATVQIAAGDALSLAAGTGAGVNAGTIDVDNGGTLALGGAAPDCTFDNAGRVNLRGSRGSALVVASPQVTLTGGGGVLLAGSGSAITGGGAVAVTLDNQELIAGAGTIGGGGLSLVNGGRIVATGGAALTINLSSGSGSLIQYGTVTNGGLLESVSRGSGSVGGLVVAATVIDNTGAGEIAAIGPGAHVDLTDGAGIEGGTLATSGGGVITIDSGANCAILGITAAVTLNGSLAVQNGATLSLSGTLVNDGVVALQGTTAYTTLFAYGTGSVWLTGGGTIELGGSGFGGIASNSSGFVNVNDTIAGAGVIVLGSAEPGLTFDNRAKGVIDANAGTLLNLVVRAFSNEGLIEATNGGGLNIGPGTTITNSGTILAAEGCGVILASATIVGGTLTAAADARFVTEAGTSSLSGVTLTAGTSVFVGSGPLDLFGIIANSGTIGDYEGGSGGTIVLDGTISGGTLGGAGMTVVVPAGDTAALLGVTIAAGTQVTVDATGTLTLGGIITNDGTVTEADLYASAATLDGGGAVVLTDSSGNGLPSGGSLVNAGNTISGGGVVTAATLDNQLAGVIDATGSNRLSVTVTSNEGLLEATAGAGLQLSGTFDNTGTILADGANVYLDGAWVSFGTMRTVGGEIVIEGSRQSVVGLITLAAGSTLAIAGTNYNAFDAVTLGLGSTILVDSGAFATSFNSMNMTAGSTLEVETGAAMTTFEGTIIDAGAVVQVASGAIQTTFSNTVLGAGAIVQVASGASLTTLDYVTLLAGADFQLAGTAFVTCTTISAGATLQIGTGASVDLGTALTADGTILVDGTAGASYAVIDAPTITLAGGALVLADTGGTNIVTGGSTADALWNSGGVISGAGQLGDGQLEITNLSESTIEATGLDPLVIDTGKYSEYSTTNSVVNEGVLESVNPGTDAVGGLTIADSLIYNNIPGSPGVIEANGANTHVDLTASSDIQGGIFVTANGGIINVAANSLAILDGSFSPVTLDGGLAIESGATLVVFGRLNNSGTIVLQGTGSSSNEIAILSVGGPQQATLTGGGVVQLGTSGDGFIDGYGLVNTDNTIVGGGGIGGSGFLFGPPLTLDNQSAGVIDANASAPIFIFDTNMTNEGVIEATGGGAAGGIQIAAGATITNTGTIQALDGGTVSIAAGDIAGQSGTTLTGGTWGASVTVAGHDALLAIAGSALSTDAATLLLSGAGSQISVGGIAIEDSLSTIAAAGTLEALGGRGFTTGNTLSDSGDIVLAGGTLSTGGLTITAAGSLTGSGTVAMAVANAGTIEAEGGLLVLAAGATGGVLQAGVGATLDLAASSSAGPVVVDGVLKLDGVTLSATALTLAGTGTLVGTGTVAAAAADAGQIEAGGGVLLMQGSVTGLGRLQADAGATLDLAGNAPLAAVAGSIVLDGAGSTIEAGAGRAIDGTLTTILTGATLAVLGGRDFAAARALSDAGTLQLGGGTLSAPALTLDPAGALTGFGSVTAATSGDGRIEAAGGLLTLAGAVTSTGPLQVDAGATLELGGGLAGGDSIHFAAATGMVRLDTPAAVAATFVGFGGGDAIDLGGAVATGLAYSTTTRVLTVTGASGTIAELNFLGSYTQQSFGLNPDGTAILDAMAQVTAQWTGGAAPALLPSDFPAPPLPPGHGGTALSAQASIDSLSLMPPPHQAYGGF